MKTCYMLFFSHCSVTLQSLFSVWVVRVNPIRYKTRQGPFESIRFLLMRNAETNRISDIAFKFWPKAMKASPEAPPAIFI